MSVQARDRCHSEYVRQKGADSALAARTALLDEVGGAAPPHAPAALGDGHGGAQGTLGTL